MADKRQQILDAVKTRMETISIANTYRTDVGANELIFLERATKFAEDELPAINISDEGSPVIDDLMKGALGRLNRRLRVKFEIKCSGTTSGAVVRQIKEDIQQAIGTDVQWSTLAVNTFFIEDFVAFDHEELKIAGASLTVDVWYTTNEWDSD